MDDDVMELIVTLCTRAGMIVEDVSTVAVTVPRTWCPQSESALEQLVAAANTIGHLVATAQSLAAGARSAAD